jgi:hypothetical protein
LFFFPYLAVSYLIFNMKDAHDTTSMTEVEDIEGKPAATHEALAATYVPGTDEEKKLVRKIDLYLLPCIWWVSSP